MCQDHSSILMPFCNFKLWNSHWGFNKQNDIEIDSCLAETIHRMNTKEGIQTIDCCCRHGDLDKDGLPLGVIILIDSHSVYNAIKAGYKVTAEYTTYWEDETTYDQPWYKGGMNDFQKEYLILGTDHIK